MKAIVPTKYFKVEKENELAGLFQSNSPDIIDIQVEMLHDFTVSEVTESDYKILQAKAKWREGKS